MQGRQPPRFRNPDKVQLLPERTWLRYYMPSGSEGFVAEDGDLIIDVFGNLVGREHSEDGRLMLVQVKYGTAAMGYGQKRVYELMHRLMRRGDTGGELYRGCYIVHWYSKEVTLDGRLFQLSSQEHLMELEELLSGNPDLVDKAKWWISYERGQPGLVKINGKKLTLDEFRAFLLGELDVPSLFDG